MRIEKKCIRVTELVKPENSFLLKLLRKYLMLVSSFIAQNFLVTFAARVAAKLEARVKGIIGIRNDCAVRAGLWKPAVCGAFLGIVVGFVFTNIAVLAVLCAVAVIFFLFPAFGVASLFLITPLVGFMPHPSICLLILSVPIGLGFLAKLGAKKIKLQITDFELMIFAFAFLILWSGVFGAGGAKGFFDALLYFVFICLCIPFSRLLEGKTGEYAADAIVLGASASSAVGIWQIFFGGFESGWLDSSVFSGIRVRITSTFDNPNVYASYLLLVFPFVLEKAFFSKKIRKRFTCFVRLALLSVCMIETWSRGAWLGLLLEMILFFILRLRKAIPYAAVGLPAAGAFLLSLSPNIAARFASIGNMSDTSVSYRISAWKGVGKMLRANNFIGIGVGESAFRSVYPLFAYSGASAVKHSHNLYLQTLVETGIVGFGLFAVIVLVFGVKCLRAFSRENNGIVSSGFSAVCGIMFMGLTDCVWYSPRIFLLFWLIVFLSLSKIRSLKGVHQ